MYPVYRPAFINNMSIRHGLTKESRDLLQKLSSKELEILLHHDDLLDRIKEIAKMPKEELDQALRTNYKLKVDSWWAGDVLICASEEASKPPSWWQDLHIGWVFDANDTDELCAWARDFLLQEVKINLWMRYIEHKKSKQKAKPPEVDPADILAAAAGYQMYL